MQARLYLDHAATTPVLREAREAVADSLASWANPSSPHGDGRRAHAALEQARRSIAEALGWRHDVILTSGASEAVQIVAARARLQGRIVGATEHDAVVAAMGDSAQIALVGPGGLLDLDALETQLTGQGALVAVQLVNNETGVVQPIARIAEIAAAAGSQLVCDCAQAAGKIDLPDADFIAISAHKFGGPPGIGALLVRDLSALEPSGGQEGGYRRGTQNLPAVAGMAAALQSEAYAAAMPGLGRLRKRLECEIVASGGLVVAADSPRIATIGAYALPGVESAAQLVALDLAGIAVSAGSACSSGSMKPSRVLSAMGLSDEIVSSVIRVSFGPSTTEGEIDRFLGEWRKIADRGRSRAA